MARLLVISRSMALALRLADDHQVVEDSLDRPAALKVPAGIDVVVLDLGDPRMAIRVLDQLRSAGDRTPTLIVSGYHPAWAGLVAVQAPGTTVIPLPITRAALLAGIDRLLLPPPPRPVPVPASAPVPGRAAEPGGWHAPGFTWWADPAPTRPLRRGWP